VKKVIKVKRQATPVDRFPDCVLVPVSKRKPHYPLVQSNVLPNTYYRVVKDEDRVRTMVTVMPDGLMVAWDSCAKCHRHHTQCECKTGIYHSASIGWIRATYDVNYPTERVSNYSMYHDPYMRLEGRKDLQVCCGHVASRSAVRQWGVMRTMRAATQEPLHGPRWGVRGVAGSDGEGNQ